MAIGMQKVLLEPDVWQSTGLYVLSAIRSNADSS